MPWSIARRAPAWFLWAALTVLATAAMVSVRGSIDQAHVALIYLMVILGGSASGGRAIGVALAIAGFLSLDYYFQPPYSEFGVGKRPDWLVLIAFLATALVATHLLARAKAQAEAARRRAEEIDRLSALGAETLNAGRAEEALAAIAGVIRDTIRVATCEIFVRNPDTGVLDSRATAGEATPEAARDEVAAVVRAVAERETAAAVGPQGARDLPLPSGGAAIRLDGAPTRELVLPLVAHERTVGVLRLADARGITLDEARARFLSALAYYAALGVERVRLVAAAERAEALREADRLKDALLASVSHDLRTPLTTIKALAHDLAARGEERAVIIEHQADRLNRVVADLLELSRLKAGALPVRPEINAAEDLVGAAIQQVSGASAGREIRTSIQWEEPVMIGRFDFVHALRIVVNLIDNALKYSSAETPVDVVVRRDGAWLVFSVADRGLGVPSAERERIFEPFYRFTGTAAQVVGAGLGLAISRRLAEAQGGTLTVDDREGGGTVFTLRLPAATLDESGGALAPSAGAASSRATG